MNPQEVELGASAGSTPRDVVSRSEYTALLSRVNANEQRMARAEQRVQHVIESRQESIQTISSEIESYVGQQQALFRGEMQTKVNNALEQYTQSMNQSVNQACNSNEMGLRSLEAAKNRGCNLLDLLPPFSQPIIHRFSGNLRGKLRKTK